MSSFGKNFKITLFGESHGSSVGVLIDGMPSGVLVNKTLIEEDLKRRRPKHFYESPRKEEDEYFIESGVYEGYTTGTPILVRVLNKKYDSSSYKGVKDIYRPSHVDFVLKEKYKGFHNLPGSGHFSGRLTIGIVIAGAFAKMVLNKYQIKTELVKVGTLTNMDNLDEYLKEVMSNKTTVGANLTTTIKGVDIGLGEPYFNKIDSVISQILFSIPSVKGVSFGNSDVTLLGHEYVDPFIDEFGGMKSNNSGGINGGITNGNDLVVNTFIRPISSFKKEIETFNFKEKKLDKVITTGNHDSFIGKRIGVVIENAIMIALLDLYLQKGV